MSTATETHVEREARKRLDPLLDGTLYTLTNHTRSQTDRVRVFAVEDGEIREITFSVAKLLGMRLSDAGIPMKGGGYSKALEIVDSVHRRLRGNTINQQLWREL